MKRLALVALLATVAGLAHAEGFRCGNKLVTDGDTRGAVVAKCGDPTEVEKSSILVPSIAWIGGHAVQVGGALIEVPVELWLYNLGPNKLIRRIRFENDRVVAIDTLGYGYIVESP